MAEEIKSREKMIYALTEIAQLEHTLMCQYLFASASMKSSTSEFSGPRQYHEFELVREWKKNLLVVAREEMQHLTFAINLLISVGGSPVMFRPNFPNYNRFYKKEGGSGLLMSLERFSINSIKRFILFEAPPPLHKLEALEVGVPSPNYYATLHEFYTSVKTAFTDEMFIDENDQYDVNEGDVKDPLRLRYRTAIGNKVKTAEEARNLIETIIEQGEGSTGSDPMAHVNTFRRMLLDYESELNLNKDFDPSRTVIPNLMTRISDDLEESLVKEVTIVDKTLLEGLPHNLMQFFNGAYEILLTWLFQIFDRRGKTEELLAIETLAFMPFMTEVIRPTMEFLTKVPVHIGDKEGYLGASFEVSTNNFMLPASEVSLKITLERFDGLIKLSEVIAQQISQSKNPAIGVLLNEFDFLKETIRIFREEFKSRVLNGWPPDTKDLSPNSESSQNVSWKIRNPHILQLEFQGWFQCRLATDPDGAFDRRGVSGNAFAIGSEPDLDRIIRFQANGNTVNRSHCPLVGVNVVRAQIFGAPLGLNCPLKDVPQFVDAKVDLLNNPKFEGRNHLVSEDGEPIDPFEVSIETKDGFTLRRSVIHTQTINSMTAVERRKTGRFPTSKASVSIEACHENLKRIGNYKTPLELIEQRIAALKSDLEGKENDTTAEVEGIKFRLNCLDDTLKSSRGIPVRTGVRWTRFFFNVTYEHTLSGSGSVKIDDKQLGFLINDPDPKTKWLIEYHMGFFDSDALAGFVYGTLKVPVIMR